MEAMIVKSMGEAARKGIEAGSLGGSPGVIAAGDASGALDRALRTMYWGLDRFQRSRTLAHFKAKFCPSWEDRCLAVPGAATLPEVLLALVLAHLPPLAAAMVWARSSVASILRPGQARPAPA